MRTGMGARVWIGVGGGDDLGSGLTGSLGLGLESLDSVVLTGWVGWGVGVGL